MIFLTLWISIGAGVENGFLEIFRCTALCWWAFAGLSGKRGIKLALKIR